MPLKFKPAGPDFPANFRSMEGAFKHFLKTWYEPPETDADAAEIRMAFFAGATYMKNLVHMATKMDKASAQTHISRLYKELIDQAEAQRRPAAAIPQEPRPEVPLENQLVIASAPAQPAPSQQQSTEQKPMMWTYTMVREFETAYQGAVAAQAPTFGFKDKHFRTVDAPAIINHLKGVFAADQPQQPQAPPPIPNIPPQA